jgi:hypothetical protein
MKQAVRQLEGCEEIVLRESAGVELETVEKVEYCAKGLDCLLDYQSP